jgi:hypothetical protein
MIFIKKPKDAQILIINTCTVTSKTDYKYLQIIRKWKRSFPGQPSSLQISFSSEKSSLNRLSKLKYA